MAKQTAFKIEPLPCPFCGEEPTIQAWHGGPKTKRMVRCDNEYCDVSPGVTGSTRNIAIAIWNKRAPVTT
jgi:hypothetical protein